MKSISLKLLTFFACFCLFSPLAQAYGDYNKTIGVSVYGSIPLVDTLPEMDLGIGGGMFFDYRFNERFSLMIEGFFTTQDGKGRSNGEGNINMIAVPEITFKAYILNNASRIDPYIGVGVGLYALTEGSASNSTGGFGVGANIEVAMEINIADNLMGAVGGTFRSVGIINSLSGTANASAIMPYTLFGRIGYRF